MKETPLIIFLKKISVVGMFFVFFLGFVGVYNGCKDPYGYEKDERKREAFCNCKCECRKDTIINKHCSK